MKTTRLPRHLTGARILLYAIAITCTVVLVGMLASCGADTTEPEKVTVTVTSTPEPTKAEEPSEEPAEEKPEADPNTTFAQEFALNPETLPALRRIARNGEKAGRLASDLQTEAAASKAYEVASDYILLQAVHKHTEANDSDLGQRTLEMLQVCERAYTDSGDGLVMLDIDLITQATEEIDDCSQRMGVVSDRLVALNTNA